MEDLRPDSGRSLAKPEEDDEFYEDIEAPKFVDFTTPDQSRLDNRSWFCLRVGCDQSHEEVDHEELYRSFKSRVMAARSPNIRFQRAFQQGSRTIAAKCPQSAPAKALRKPMARMGCISSISEKTAMAKLKQHQISSLRESQNQSIEEKQPLLSEKARPTPRKRNVKPNLEPVRNAMNQETPLVVNATKVKSLFLQIPDKAVRCSRTPGSELCSEVKKNLKIDCGRRLEGSSAMSSKKHQGSCVASKSCKRLTKNGARFMEIAVGQVKENCTNQNEDISEKDQTSRHAKMDNDSKESVKPNNVVSMNLDRHQVCNGEGGNGRRTWCNITDNENKENLLVIHENRDITSNAANLVDKSSNEESKNPPPEDAKVQGKPFKDHSLQGRKLKKLTNPKPFRLRTDERGILKEANLERKLQAEFMKEPASQVQKKETICRTNLVRTPETKLAKNNQMCMVNGLGIRDQAKEPASHKKETICRTNLVRNPEAKLAKNNQICMNDNKKKKQEFVPRVCKEKGGSIKLPRLEQGVEAKGYAGCVQGRKKSATIPSEPKFHKIHVPKSCTKGLVHHEILKRQ